MRIKCYLLVFLILIASSTIFAAEPEQNYQDGLKAYNKGDYFPASEHLFAYLQMAGSGLTADFLKQIKEALTYAESQVMVAIETKKMLDEHGRVIKITIDASGSADSSTPIEKTKTFHPPPGVNRPKPNLPTQPEVKQSVKINPGKVYKPVPGILLPGETANPVLK